MNIQHESVVFSLELVVLISLIDFILSLTVCLINHFKIKFHTLAFELIIQSVFRTNFTCIKRNPGGPIYTVDTHLYANWNKSLECKTFPYSTRWRRKYVQLVILLKILFFTERNERRQEDALRCICTMETDTFLYCIQ